MKKCKQPVSRSEFSEQKGTFAWIPNDLIEFMFDTNQILIKKIIKLILAQMIH